MTEAIGVGDFALARRLAAVDRYHAAYNMDGRLWLLLRAVEAGEQEGDFTQALGLLTEDVRVSYDFIAPFVRAWSGVASGKPAAIDHGLAQMTGMGEDLPLRIHAPEQLAYMYLSLGRPEDAKPLIDRVLSRARGREAALRLNFADGLAAAGARDDALALLDGRDAVLIEARARLAAGKSLGMRVDRPSQALGELMLALAIQLNSASDPRLPLSFAQLARSVNPDNPEAAVITALLLDTQERPDEALAVLRTIDDRSPLAPQLRDSEIQVLLRADRGGEALKVAGRDTVDHPARPGVWARYGDALSEAKRWGEAADAYARERVRSPGEWQVLFLEAVARKEAGDWPAARDLLNTALSLAPEEPIVLNYLGYVSLEQGDDLERADALVRAASALAPGDPSITDSLGWAFYKLGRFEQAEEILGRAARLDPAQAEIHEHHGDVLWKLGRTIEARFAWAAARVSAEEAARIDRLDDKLEYGLTTANAAP